MSAFKLRCKSSQGHCVIDSLTGDSTLADLVQEVHSRTGILNDDLTLKHGYPPRPIDLSDKTKTMKTANIKSGDTVIVESLNGKVANPSGQAVISDTSEQMTKPSPKDYSDFMGSQILTRQTVPANNSCLFTSVNFCLSNGVLDLSCAPSMRRLIADYVRKNPDVYTAAVLDMPPEKYCSKIMDNDQWGGGIDLEIMTKHFQVEIDVVDTQTIRIDKFGEGSNYSERILLIYDGIHYDPLALEDFAASDADRLKTRFRNDDDNILRLALELAKEAKSSRQFTDVGKFKIKCMQCNIYITGEKEAQEHAKTTGHANFQEV